MEPRLCAAGLAPVPERAAAATVSTVAAVVASNWAARVMRWSMISVVQGGSYMTAFPR